MSGERMEVEELKRNGAVDGCCQGIVELSCTASRVFSRVRVVGPRARAGTLSLPQTPHFRFDHASGSTSARPLYSYSVLNI